MDTGDILARFERNRSFYQTGGITATGGEPMGQIDFLTELFAGAKKSGIHTCLDTSGIFFPCKRGSLQNLSDGKKTDPDIHLHEGMLPWEQAGITMDQIERLMEVTDLVMLDIKHIDDASHKRLTGWPNTSPLSFAAYLDKINKPVWIRHVVVPGITWDQEELTGLGRFLRTLSNVEKLEVLPYHSMGKVKYDSLGIPYRLADTPQLKKEEAKKAEEMIRDAWGK